MCSVTCRASYCDTADTSIDACPFWHFTSLHTVCQLAEQVALKSLVAEIFGKLQVAENMAQVAEVESTELSDTANTAHPVVQQQQVQTRWQWWGGQKFKSCAFRTYFVMVPQ